MTHAIIFDCEQLTDAGAPSRFWCGPTDPDPLLVQIGAVRLSLDPPFALGETFDCIVEPMGRAGPVTPSAFFTKLTGIDAARIARDGLPLARALQDFADFAGDAPLFSWGKDEITALAPACFVAGLICPLPTARFGNASALLLRAGEPLEVVHTLRSPGLPKHLGLPPEDRAHDGLADAQAVARSLAHLLNTGRLQATDFSLPCPA